MEDYILEVENLIKTYTKDTINFSFKRDNKFIAVNDVSFGVKKGEIVGLIGESGCGKTTIGRIIAKLLNADSGKILFDGKDITNMKHKEFKQYRSKIQMIFQDPSTALNPQLKIDKILREALYSINIKDKREQTNIIESYIGKVGLTDAYLDRYPHELSGGQKQRICILLALLTNPNFVVADEVVSALDLSVQAQILNLLKSLQKELKLSMLFISHDLSIIHYISDRIIVMYMGEIVESGDCEEVYENPSHPYTKLLLSSVLELNKNIDSLDTKEITKIINENSNSCVFADRCPYVQPICRDKKPESRNINDSHMSKCHFNIKQK
ncbi:ABC transporter ATP-binding protein [Sedimentibacter sp. zth1]|uniref:ABC transporter ATP-binding protein n=1 Tax=Sedimentibacter sp. zth1 TaxID=2816908 RepID=UPI001A92784D|nr:ABC transporter ATP-binding protein [Sedimentibacter sp. zth1]QSX05362.1 ABC transporter ATP-binding protein [Sedimentibacter sp. zth1]